MSETTVQVPSLDERYPLPPIDPDAEVSVVYNIFLNRVKQIDEDMDIQADPVAATRKIVRERLEEQNGAEGKSIATDFAEALNRKFPDKDTQAGVYFAFMAAVAKEFEDQYQQYITDKIASDPSLNAKSSSTAAQDELVRLRAEAVKQAKMMRDVAQIMPTIKFTEDLFPPIPTRKGKVGGERGKRAISNFNWSINGVPLTGDDNALPAIAKMYNYDNSKELRDAIQAHMHLKNLRDNLPDTLTLQLKPKSEGGPQDTLVGTKVGGTPLISPEEAEDEDEDEDEDDDES